MPTHPSVSRAVASMEGSLFSKLAHRLATHEGPIFPLHVGDTWLEPAEGCRMQDLTVEEHPGMHRYAPPHGIAPLLGAIAERVSGRTRVPATPDEILVAAGATGALGAVIGATVDAGEEVLILAPYWPLINGIIRSINAVPVAVPFLDEVDGPDSAIAAVEAKLTSRTTALYVSTPNNPTGRVMPEAWIEALAEWARARDLWLIADEVYEDYVYEGEHAYCRTFAPERTFSVHSFSKAFGMAGNRCGYVVGPRSVMPELRKVSTHSFYSTPTASQIAAARALDGRGDAWVADALPRYRELGTEAADKLGVAAPQGSQFLWLDVADRLGDGGLLGFLEGCIQEGLLVAPGPSFGPYPTHVRVCYTSAEPHVVREGIERLAAFLAR